MGNVGMRFKVQCAAKEDIYRDFVRVSEQYRLDAHGRIILEGLVCKIRTPDATAYGIVRGTGAATLARTHCRPRRASSQHLTYCDR